MVLGVNTISTSIFCIDFRVVDKNSKNLKIVVHMVLFPYMGIIHLVHTAIHVCPIP